MESCLMPGDYEYLVRPVRLETTGSGSYYNVGPGQKTEVTIIHNSTPGVKLDYQVYFDKLSLNVSIVNGSFVQLNTGDGRIIHGSLPPTLLFKEEGSYKVCLTMANLCVSIDSCFTVDVKSSLPVLNVVVSEAACSDDRGSISIEVQENRAPFEVSWAHQDTGLVLTELAAGNYMFTVTTVTGRSAVYGPFVVEIPKELSAVINTTDCDIDQNNGSLVIAQINGGTPPYTIAWIDGVFGETSQFTNLAPGQYVVQIKDSHGCLYDTTVVISRLSATGDVRKNINLVYIDKNGDLITGPDAGNTLQLKVFDLSGKLVVQGSFEKIQNFISREMTVAGMYLIMASSEQQQQVIKWMKGSN
ncbi:MAG: T9SS type A sorting domain-containing protein [Saprospiraceae bacterium]|nr:T9SS type A sorting domain-containing protein [Saprospiraceae bacterium]